MGIFSRLARLGGRDMAVDLGTANTLVYVRGRGIVLSEPSVVAIDSADGQVQAVGIEAKRMLGRTPGTITAIRPLKDGVIADFDVTEQMLRHFIKSVHSNRFAHPRVVVCVPSGVTGVERRAVEEACLSAGASTAYLIEEPIRVGGDELDDAIVSHCKRTYKLAIGAQTAERVKVEVGSASRLAQEMETEIRGRDLVAGLPKTVTLGSEEVRGALEEPVGHIVDAVKETLDRTPPELAGDIMERGITLAGGGALLQGFEQRLRDECQMPCRLAESPLTCVAIGSGKSLEEFETIHRAGKKNST
jgi:rod shape-determining protein MreB